MAQYKTGTVSVTNGSATVTGSGTLWSGEIAAGDLFTIVGDNAWYEVASVGSNTSITLSANYAGTTGSGKSYAISRDFTTRLALPYPQKGDIETASIIKRAFEQIDTETNIATANYSATSAPTANDDSGDGYSIGSWWVNVTSDEAYLCVDATVGAAVWTKISVDVPSEIVSLLAGQSVSMASLTLSGGTANGVLYLNGSKVATSGSALTFDGTNLGLGTASPISSGGYSTLTINGSTGSQIAFKSGDVAKQYIYTTATDITYRNDNGAQIWYGSGELMRLTSTGLGIGTSSISDKLTVQGSGNFRVGSGNVGIALSGASWSYSNYFNAADNSLRWYSSTGGDRIILSSDGNLGLGGTPSAWADMKAMQINAYGSAIAAWNTNRNTYILSNAYYAAGFKYSTTGGAAYYNCSGETPQHAWYIAASGTAGNAITFTQAMTLDASGNLGIGTTSPAYVLNTNYSAPSSFTNTGSNFTQMWQASGTNALGIALSTGDTTARFVTNNGYKFAWNLASTQAMTLDSSGNLLVGTTSAKGVGITVESSSNTIWTTSTNSGQSALVVQNSNGGAVNLVAFQTGSGTGSGVGSIYYSSGLTVYATTSDYRLKTVIGDVTNSGARIDALEPVEYEWKSSGERTRGFLAHKFQEVYPNSVSGEKDAVNAEGKPVYQSMQAGTAEVIADLVAELQSLRARVAALES